MAMTLGGLTDYFLNSLKPLTPNIISEPKKTPILGFDNTYFFTVKNKEKRGVILLAKKPLKFSERHNRLIELVEAYRKKGIVIDTISFKQDVDRVVATINKL